MKTQQLHFMPGKLGLKGIAHVAKGIAVMALACVFSYTTATAQTARTVPFSVEVPAGSIQNGVLNITLKMEHGDISKFTADNVRLTQGDREKTLPIRSLIMQGDYALLSLDVQNVEFLTLNTSNAGGNHGNTPNRIDLIGNLKEITIDNVSGVKQEDDPGSFSVVVIDVANMATTYTGGGYNSPAMTGNPQNTGAGNGTNTGGRTDDIITKDEVQGFVSTYPNPARNVVKIKSSHSKIEIQEVTIISAIGTKVSTQLANDGDGHLVSVDINSIPSGMYFLSIKTNLGDVVKRIVVVD